jgi:endonuclease YncB( thermonuclease family)
MTYAEGELEGKRFWYIGKVVSVYDGDTITVDVDQGFFNHTTIKGRIARIDTEEIRGGTAKTKAIARQQRDTLKDLVINKEVYINTEMDKTFDRYVIEVFFTLNGEDYINLSDYAINVLNVRRYIK